MGVSKNEMVSLLPAPCPTEECIRPGLNWMTDNPGLYKTFEFSSEQLEISFILLQTQDKV